MLSTNLIVAGAVITGAVGILGTINQGTTDSIPWDLLKTSGVTGSILFVGWYFLSRDKEQRKEHAATLTQRDETIKVVAKEFGDTATNISRTFADTTKAMDERAEKREEKLAALFQQLTRDRA